MRFILIAALCSSIVGCASFKAASNPFDRPRYVSIAESKQLAAEAETQREMQKVEAKFLADRQEAKSLGTAIVRIHDLWGEPIERVPTAKGYSERYSDPIDPMFFYFDESGKVIGWAADREALKENDAKKADAQARKLEQEQVATGYNNVRRQRAADALNSLAVGFKPKPTVNCTSTKDAFGTVRTVCN